MKVKLTTCSVMMAAATLLAPASAVHATVLFEDNFDGAQYDGGFVVYPTLGTIPYGIWQVNNLNGGVYSGLPGDRSNVSVAENLSPSRSLALNVAAANDQAQVIGILSTNGSDITPTKEAINVRFAFNRSSMLSSDLPTVFVIRSTNGNNVSVVNIGVDGRVEVAFSNGTQELSPILSDTWYYLSVEMPSNPGLDVQYKVSLFSADGTTQLNSVTGSSSGVVDASYSYFSIINNGQPASLTTYIDNVSVQTIPEPSTVGLAVAGVVGGVLFATRRKN